MSQVETIEADALGGEQLYRRALAGLIALTSVLFFLSLVIGPANLSPVEVVRALFAREDTASAVWLIVREIRLPRSLLALLVGGARGSSGAALQG